MQLMNPFFLLPKFWDCIDLICHTFLWRRKMGEETSLTHDLSLSTLTTFILFNLSIRFSASVSYSSSLSNIYICFWRILLKNFPDHSAFGFSAHCELCLCVGQCTSWEMDIILKGKSNAGHRQQRLVAFPSFIMYVHWAVLFPFCNGLFSGKLTFWLNRSTPTEHSSSASWYMCFTEGETSWFRIWLGVYGVFPWEELSFTALN